MLYKKIFFLVVVFSVISVDCMNMKSILRQDIRERLATQNEWLLASGIGRVPEDVTLACIQRRLSLQDIAHLKQTSTICNQKYDVENICPFVGGPMCFNYACGVLAENYYACTKALGHFASKKNKKTSQVDRNTFKHLWIYHEKVRNNNVAMWLGKSALSITDQMLVYKKGYAGKQHVVKSRILDHILEVLRDKDVNALKVILLGGSLNIKDLVKHYQSKRFFSDQICPGQVSEFVTAVSVFNDPELLYLLFGKQIGVFELPFIMASCTSHVIIDLIGSGMLPYDTIGNERRTILHYAAMYNHSSVIKMLLKKGICINSQTKDGNTPLHYAVIKGYVGCVMVLLSNDFCDVCLKNSYGYTAIDYTHQRWFEESYLNHRDRKIMRKLLQNRINAILEKDSFYVRGGNNAYQSL